MLCCFLLYSKTPEKIHLIRSEVYSGSGFQSMLRWHWGLRAGQASQQGTGGGGQPLTSLQSGSTGRDRKGLASSVPLRSHSVTSVPLTRCPLERFYHPPKALQAGDQAFTTWTSGWPGRSSTVTIFSCSVPASRKVTLKWLACLVLSIPISLSLFLSVKTNLLCPANGETYSILWDEVLSGSKIKKSSQSRF